jgi:hypothetical protein
MILILACGRMQSGKDTFADFLQSEFEKNNYTVCRDKAAADIKQWSCEDFQRVADYTNDLAKKMKTVLNLCADINPSLKDKMGELINRLVIKNENWFENKTELTRIFLQIYGSEIFRDRVDKDFWANRLKSRIEKNKRDVVIVTDIRFVNEIEQLSNIKGCSLFVISIYRHDIIKNENVHQSEKELLTYDGYDYEIQNAGSLEELKKSAKVLYEDLIETVKGA